MVPAARITVRRSALHATFQQRVLGQPTVADTEFESNRGGEQMSVSDNIRALAREGLKPAEIAKRLGIRYQHAYGVLKTDGALAAASGKAPADADVPPKALPVSKPTLTVDALLAGGFALSCRWVLSAAGEVVLDGQLPKAGR